MLISNLILTDPLGSYPHRPFQKIQLNQNICNESLISRLKCFAMKSGCALQSLFHFRHYSTVGQSVDFSLPLALKSFIRHRLV